MIKKEIWEPLPYKLFEDVYLVSNKGEIKCKKRVVIVDSKERGVYKRNYRERIITQRTSKEAPHYFVSLSLIVDGKKHVKTVYVHKAVALAFIPNPDNKELVSHKEHDYTNNTPENLFWSSRSEVSARNMENNPELRNTLKNNNIKSGWLHKRKAYKDDTK